MTKTFSYAVIAMLSSGSLACGGGLAPSGSAPPAATDAGGDEGAVSTTPLEAGAPDAQGVDHGAPSTTFPAFTPSFAQVVNNGGLVMKAPIIVAITWNSDPSQATYDSYADAIGGTTYWNETTSQYGVGPAVSGAANHVHIATAAPASLSDSDLQTMVQTYAGAGDGGADGGDQAWPAPTSNTIYAFFLPPGLSLNLGAQGGGGGGGSGDACAQGVGGYHDQVSVGSITTSYAVVDSCNLDITPTVEDQTTASMSHELIEAATDPQPNDNEPGWIGFDNDHFAFDYFQQFQDEIGDACELYVLGGDSVFYEDTESQPAPFDAWVQRTWSNANGPLGHNPCVPAPADPYFNVAPLDLQEVDVTLPARLTGSSTATKQPTKGYKVVAGTSATFALGFYSDADTGGPWIITASEGNPLAGGGLSQFNKSSLKVTLDTASGQNGTKAYMTVKVTTSGSTFNGELVTITSSLGQTSHFMPIWIAGQ